ncbi:histidinol-phosphate aminotransferase [Fibrobacter sp. UWR3]|uniref:histidinol-phosphate transaminase n=1 Tax=Fibrobacter sp. UWR3 TaxID=1896217 RepID=UPI0009144C20|nr:histidinol-phosphate transaminase [Fibrobacter sp. UWR3]SHM35803.1 histidinol-phosphate aminotransferase [Fibrobacter sp. UWR3]
MIEPRPELSKLSDYVPGKSIEEIRERFGLDKVVKLASNENPLGASPKAVEAFHRIADSLHLYPRGDAPKLIDSIAKMYGVETSQIVVGNGSDEIIDMVGKAFIRQGDNCVGITPTFSVYKFTTLSNGADFIGVGEGEARTSLDELAKAINDKTRVAFICNPNNPTGAYYTESEIREFLKKVPQNVLVFLDEAYAEFATAPDYPNMAKFVGEYSNLFVNRTFSKIYGLAGLRVGYAFGSTEVVRALWKVKPPFDVNQAAQVAAIAALGDKEHVQATRKMNAEGIDVLTREFSALGLKVLPTQANFICVRIGERAKELVAFLESNGMIVRGLTSFGMPEYIRVTIGKPEENAFLMELVKKWCEA